MVQFRSTTLNVDRSNPVNEDFESLIDSDDGELIRACPEWFA